MSDAFNERMGLAKFIILLRDYYENFNTVCTDKCWNFVLEKKVYG